MSFVSRDGMPNNLQTSVQRDGIDSSSEQNNNIATNNKDDKNNRSNNNSNNKRRFGEDLKGQVKRLKVEDDSGLESKEKNTEV